MKRKLIQMALNESVDELCEKYEKLLDDFKIQSSNTKTLEDQYEKVFGFQ